MAERTRIWHGVLEVERDCSRRSPTRPIGDGSALLRSVALALAVISTPACSDGARRETDVSVVDSAGVEIVTSAPLASGARCALGDEPTLALGAIEGADPYLFHQIRDAARLSDGSVAVVDGGSREIRLFAGTGEHLRSMGGAGEGPGEFRGPWLLWVMPGDTLWASDYMPWRFNVFSRVGEFSRAVQPDPYQLHAFVRGGVLADGTSVNVTQAMAQPGAEETTLLVLAHGPDGALTDTVASLPGPRLEPVSDLPGFFLMPVFHPGSLVAARGSAIAMTSARDPEVRILDTEYQLRRIVRWLEPDRDVTDRHVQAFREDYMTARGGRDSPGWSAADEASIGDSRTVSDRFPTASDLMLGRDGRVWVKRFTKPRAEPEWMAFGPEGGFVCRLAPGSNLTPYEFGADYMLGLGLDDLGTERVLMYPLHPPEH